MITLRGSKYRGQFWLPNNPSIVARGELTIDKDGDVELAIEGSGDLGVFLATTTPRSILGRIAADYEYDVTLLDTFIMKSRVRSRGDIHASIACNGLLIGHHIEGRDDPQFRKVDVSMSCLSEWSGLFGFSGKAAFKGDWRAIKQKNQKSRAVSLTDGSVIYFLTSYEGPLVFDQVKSVSLSETDYVRLECPHKQTIDQIWQRVHTIRSLVGFGMRRAAYVEDIVLFLPGGARSVLIFAKSGGGDARPTTTPLFTLPALSRGMTRHLRAWHDNFRKLGPVLALISLADYQIGTYSTSQFLSYAQALETFHRRTRKGRFEDHDDYKPTLAVLKRAIPGGLSEDYKKRIEAGLNHLNEWALLQRLYDLYDLEARNIRRLFPDRERDMRLIRDVRNYLTHFEDQKGRMEKYIQERAFIILTRKLRFFVELCLLRSMGINDAATAELLTTVREYQRLAKREPWTLVTCTPICTPSRSNRRLTRNEP